MSMRSSGDDSAGNVGKLAKVLDEIWLSSLPVVEKRKLCARVSTNAMMYSAASSSATAARASSESQAYFETILSEIGQEKSLGRRATVSEAKHFLRTHCLPDPGGRAGPGQVQGSKLASKLSRLSRARNSLVHDAENPALMTEIRHFFRTNSGGDTNSCGHADSKGHLVEVAAQVPFVQEQLVVDEAQEEKEELRHEVSEFVEHMVADGAEEVEGIFGQNPKEKAKAYIDEKVKRGELDPAVLAYVVAFAAEVLEKVEPKAAADAEASDDKKVYSKGKLFGDSGKGKKHWSRLQRNSGADS